MSRTSSLLLLASFLGFLPAQAALDLQTAAGQLFIFGLPVARPGGLGLENSTIKHFKDLKAGSFILFRRDLHYSAQIKSLTDHLHSIGHNSTSSPSLIAVDQEGGVVARVPFSPPLPSARSLGAAASASLSHLIGKETAQFLRQLGLNGNLAPVLDLGSENGSFIGSRSYSSQALVVSEMGNAFAEGLAEGKVLPVAKHFPGIGPVTNDPHLTLVRRSTPISEMLSQDLLPFRKFSSLYPSGLMISHLIYPTLDPQQVPGTFSREISQKYARDIVGFQGLLMTDDLLMIKTKTLQEFQSNIQKAFLAGADLMMISWSIEKQKAAVEALLLGVKEGKFQASDIIARAERVLQVRKDLGRPLFSAPLSKEKIQLSPSASYIKALDQLAFEIFHKELRQLSLNPINQFVFLNPSSSFEKTLQLSGHQLPRTRIKNLNECSEQKQCVYFLTSKKDLPTIKNILRKSSQSNRSKILIISLYDDDLPVDSVSIIRMTVRSPKWAQHFLKNLNDLWIEKEKAGDAKQARAARAE